MSTIIKLRCIDQVLTFESTPVIASGGMEEDRLQVSFCSKWDGLTRTAVFWRTEDDAFHVPLDQDDSCVIPAEVLEDEGVFYFGLFGVSSDGRQRTTEVIRYTVKKGAITSGTKPPDPTPDVYTQLLTQYTETKSIAQQAVSSASASASAAAASQKAAAASQKAAEESAKSAAQAVPVTRKVNGKALSEDITLSAADVGAVALDGSIAMTGGLNFKSVNNGYGRILKSHSDTLDYGTFIRDYAQDGKYVSLVLRAGGNALNFVDGNANSYRIYHQGNKPTAEDVGALDNTSSGQTIPNNSDLNDYITPGIYKSGGSSASATIANAPFTNSGFKMIVTKHYSTTGILQIVLPITAASPFMYRYYEGGAWYGWRKVYDTGVKPTAADVGAVALNGSNTMTGSLKISKDSVPGVEFYIASGGSAFVSKNANATTDNGVQLNDYDASGNRAAIQVLGRRWNSPSNVAIVGVSNADKSINNTYNILHTGNLDALNIGQIVTGSYVGTGAYGEANPNSLTFDKPPKFLAICDTNGEPIFNNTSGNIMRYMGMTDALSAEYKTNVWMRVQGSSGWGPTGHAKCSEDRKTISWYVDSTDTESTGVSAQCNNSGQTYRYMAIL